MYSHKYIHISYFVGVTPQLYGNQTIKKPHTSLKAIDHILCDQSVTNMAISSGHKQWPPALAAHNGHHCLQWLPTIIPSNSHQQ